MSLLRLPPWIFGILVVTAFVTFALAGLYVFQRISAGRLKLSEELNNQVIFPRSLLIPILTSFSSIG